MIVFKEFFFTFISGVRIQNPFLNNPLSPASGPEFSVPAIGCPGIKSIPLGRYFFAIVIIDFFTEPTSVTIAFSFKCQDIFFNTLE